MNSITPPTPPTTPPAQGVARDMEAFGRLPARTRELELLRDASEKAIGPEGLALDKKIQAATKAPAAPAPDPAG